MPDRNPQPSPNGQTARAGRTSTGRFAPGNPGGPGNPHGRRSAWFRERLLEAVTDRDIQAVVRALVSKAKAGDIAAIRELLNRLLGRVPEAPDADAIEPPTMPSMSEEALQAMARSLRRGCEACDCPKCTEA